MKATPRTLLAGITSLIVVAAVIAGIWILPPHADVRIQRLDARRVQDLRLIYGAMNGYYNRYKALPPDLAALEREPDTMVSVTDPETHQYYEYHALDGGKYEVCAHFDEPTPKDATAPANSFWLHGAGRQCFKLEARVIR